MYYHCANNTNDFACESFYLVFMHPDRRRFHFIDEQQSHGKIKRCQDKVANLYRWHFYCFNLTLILYFQWADCRYLTIRKATTTNYLLLFTPIEHA